MWNIGSSFVGHIVQEGFFRAWVVTKLDLLHCIRWWVYAMGEVEVGGLGDRLEPDGVGDQQKSSWMSLFLLLLALTLSQSSSSLSTRSSSDSESSFSSTVNLNRCLGTV